MRVQPSEEASSVLEFWKAAGHEAWFEKNPEFDARFRERFAEAHARAAAGALSSWLEAPLSALALVLLLDQYPRNAFRGTPRMYETDELAREAAKSAIARGHDRAVEPELQVFFYLPLSHSEDLGDQQRSVALHERLSPELQKHAVDHADIVQRFGRFPHRNALLGRVSTPEEREFLAEGGFAG
ncbi:MAG: DUF924 family protein [Myxococcales bacterium]|nr:MAG: DUF924 family protein [Myxococcales bacterium]